VPHTEPLPRHFLRALGAAVFATAVFAAWLGWRIGGERTVLYFSDAGTVLAPLIAVVACIRAGWRHAKPVRMFWWLLGAACGAWMLGEIIWTGYDLAGTGGPPVPSVADIGYLAFIPLAVGALLSHPGLRERAMRQARTLFDGLAIGVALLFLSWTFVLGPLWRSGDLTTLGGVVTLAYPVGDVIIAFFVMLALLRMGTGHRPGLWCLLGGLIALALADSAYAYIAEVKHYTTGNLLDTGWFAGFLGIALGARASELRDPPARADASSVGLPSLVAPLLPMFVALSAVAISIDFHHRPDRVGAAMVAALILLAFVRQALLVVDLVTTGRGTGRGSVIDWIARVALGHGATPKARGTRPEGLT
jgi:hypothetical protein